MICRVWTVKHRFKSIDEHVEYTARRRRAKKKCQCTQSFMFQWTFRNNNVNDSHWIISRAKRTDDNAKIRCWIFWTSQVSHELEKKPLCKCNSIQLFYSAVKFWLCFFCQFFMTLVIKSTEAIKKTSREAILQNVQAAHF